MSNIEKIRILLNNLISRLDSLHDFCEKNTETSGRTRPKNLPPNMTYSEEFARIFKPEILFILNELNQDLSYKNLESSIKLLIDNLIKDKNMKDFYKTNLLNLLDRKTDSLIFTSNHTIDKDTFTKIKDRNKSFEIATVVFFELLCSFINEEINIGKFISNKYLPIYNYIESSNNKLYYSLYDNNQKIYNTINFDKNKNKNREILDEFIQKSINNKENIISFILGDYDNPNQKGFYQVNNYYKYLQEFRFILGKYYNIRNDRMIYLIVDTTKISFAKYYKNLTDNEKENLQLKVLCNVASEWDAANSGECIDDNININNISNNKIFHNNKSIDTAIFSLQNLNLKKEGINTKVSFSKPTDNNFNNSFKNASSYPCEVNKIGEEIRNNIKKHFIIDKGQKKLNKESGYLLDFKRTGDALQSLMTKQLNDANSDNYFAIFVTIDHLAFLKARLNNIPAMYTALQNDKIGKENFTNRVIILYNNNFEINYLAIYNKFLEEYKKCEEIYDIASDYIPIININDIIKYYNITTPLIEHFTKMLFGIIKGSKKDNENYDIIYFINEIANKNYLPINIEKIEQIYINDETLNICIYENINLKIDNILENIKINVNKYYEIISQINDIITTRNKLKDHKYETIKINNNFIDLNIIYDIFENYINNSFKIEAIYNLRRLKTIFNYFYDFNIYSEEIKKFINNLNKNKKIENIKNNYQNIIKYTQIISKLNEKYKIFLPKGEKEKIYLNILFNFDKIENINDLDNFKIMIDNIFNFKVSDYEEIIDLLDDNIQNIFDKIIIKETKNILNNIEKNNFFDEPVGITKNNLSVSEKIQKYQEYFDRTLPQLLPKILYNNIDLLCQNFYKNKTSSFNLTNINNKPIDIDTAFNNILNDIYINKKGGVFYPMNEDTTYKSYYTSKFTKLNKKIIKSKISEPSWLKKSKKKLFDSKSNNFTKNQTIDSFLLQFVSTKKSSNNKQTINSIQTVHRQSIESQLISIKSNQLNFPKIFYILDNELLFNILDDNTTNKTIKLSQIDNNNKIIYNNYKYFLNDIYKHFNFEYLPDSFIEINQKIYDKIIHLINNKYINDTIYIVPIYDNYDNITYVINFIDLFNDSIINNKNKIKEIINVIFDNNNIHIITNLISNVLQNIVNELYNSIYEFYIFNSNIKTFYNKDMYPLQDLVIWIMINDPYLLLTHPNRDENWINIENFILNSKIIKHDSLYYNINDNISSIKNLALIKYGYCSCDEYIKLICIFNKFNILKLNLDLLIEYDSNYDYDYNKETYIKSVNNIFSEINNRITKKTIDFKSNKYTNYTKKRKRYINSNYTNSSTNNNISVNSNYNSYKKHTKRKRTYTGGFIEFKSLKDYYKKYYKPYYNLYY